jgi:cephalosporin hydroxylase
MNGPAGILRRILPQAVANRLSEARQYRRLRHDLAGMRREYASCRSLDAQVDMVRGNKNFGAMQRTKEMVSLLKMLEENPPGYLCEIGTALGGTLFLLAQVSSLNALLLSVDLEISRGRSLAIARFAAPKQRVVSIRGDSHAPETVRRVREKLAGKQLDLLFIDGDHSYEGVKADFVNYGPMVRPGGIIAFHDIVCDFGNLYGGVSVFWKEIRDLYRTSEIIADCGQDGDGIGIVYK